MKEPHNWAYFEYAPIDYQDSHYYAAPKKPQYQSLDEVDPKILETFEKLGVPINEQKALAGVAVDAVVDSVSVATTFKKTLEKKGIIFCSFSEAVKNHPELVRKHLATVVPSNDNFFCRTQLSCIYRWIFLLHTKRRTMPNGTFHIL